MTQRKLLPTFSAVAAGQTASCQLDLGNRYHVIWLELGDSAAVVAGGAADTAAHIQANIGNLVNQIRLKVNGNVQRTMYGTELNLIQGCFGTQYLAYSSYGMTSGGITNALVSSVNYCRWYLPIFLTEPWRTRVNGQTTKALVAANSGDAVQELSAWNAVGIDQLTIEVDVGTGLTTPVVSGFYEYDAPTGNIGSIVKWIRTTLQASGTQNDFNQLTKRDYYSSIHLFPFVWSGTSSTGVGRVGKYRFTANGTYVHDLLDSRETGAIQLGRGLNPDLANDNRVDILFDYDDDLDNVINANGLNEFTLHAEYFHIAAGVDSTYAAATNLVTISRRLGPPE